MNTMTFDQFSFDPQSLELRNKQGQVLELRPKTAELLRVLVAERDRVVGKRELITRIWHTEHVTDQSVFQAMSELRRRLAPLKPIKTFPNRGYQWVLPVSEESLASARTAPPLWRRAAAAAVAAVGLAAAISIMSNLPSLSDTTSVTIRPQSLAPASSLPALVAFSEGAAALQRGEVARALELLELSVTERPEFVEARLLLSEAYLLSGQAHEARQRVHSVMQELTPETNAYALIAAMDLLSRTDRELGSMSSALEWAARAADQANSSGYECTAADLHDRVLAMASDPTLNPDALKTSPVFASDFARRMLNTAFVQRERAESALTREAGLAQLSSQASKELSTSHDSAFEPVLPVETLPQSHGSSPGSGALSPVIHEGDAGKRPAHCDRFPGSSTAIAVPMSIFENV